VKSFSLIFFISLFFAGCKEEYPVYQQFPQASLQNFPSCLHYMVHSKEERQALSKAFAKKDDPLCPYHVMLIRYHVGNCNNPVVKSVGGDFNGYVRVEIKKGFKCYYKIQSDYKNSEEAAFERVLKRIEKTQKEQKKNKNI